ncbi:DUF1848 domain-containing protein [Breznakiella homolactica]|uniref:DUF1848 domain-containing protein n=1 Tax=Breznakiella homolactica TaxID=2798577 RepID=A0A7T7XM29_9SPIR|nr:DUF1848 domain-containing protein [Breznakiella homolactica]QQO08880.1 DUF1848 domain-containing protein [Breznakiella homolactica]
MILSVSRRTDIPRFYFDWFLRRLREGYALVRNPMNRRQVSRVSLSPETIDCIAFWTKNPEPMFPELTALDPYPYFIQFTVNAYGEDIEGGLPKKARLLDTFRKLSGTIGAERTVWRYSPVLLGRGYTPDHHRTYFEKFARHLEGRTELCRISFLDLYAKITPRMNAMGITDVPEQEKLRLVQDFAEIGKAHGISLGGCGNLDLAAAGLKPLGCIDAALVSRVSGRSISPGKDPGQRTECYCVPSVDIGSYNTCRNGCVYCYANHSHDSASDKAGTYDPDSPMLCDYPRPDDRITERRLGKPAAGPELF